MSTYNRYDALSSLDSLDAPTSVLDRPDKNTLLHKGKEAKTVLEEQDDNYEKKFGVHQVRRLRADKWRNLIDKEVLKQYESDVILSQGFDIDNFPGYIQGVTSIVPLFDISKKYDKMMELATTAMKTYNKKHQHQSKYKVVEVKKVNRECFDWSTTYYITFSAVRVRDNNVSLQSIIASACTCLMIVMLTLLVWFGIILPPYNQTIRNCERLLLKLKSAPELKATEYELSELSESNYTTFQTKVEEQYVVRKREILFCRAKMGDFMDRKREIMSTLGFT